MRIYCGVKFIDKDTAKSHGAKWNMKEKNWYFEFNLNEFYNEKKCHGRSHNQRHESHKTERRLPAQANDSK